VSKLPEGWSEKRLGEVLTFNYGKALPEKVRQPGNVPVYGSNGAVGTHEKYLIDGPAIIIGRKGSVGEVHLSKSPCWPIDTTYFVNKFGNNSPVFWFWYLKYLNLDELDRATAIPGLNREDAYKLNVLVPPPAEQRRIVARLDALLGHLRRAREELARVSGLVERQRQAVLAAAFRGELTSTWRKDANTIEKGPWPIPQSWSWGVIADVAEVASNLVSPNEVLDLPHIAPNHIEAGVPKLLAFNTVREDGVISPKHRFFSGQIVYSKIRPYLRKAVLVDFDGACSADMYPIRAKYHPKYLLYWLISHDFNDLRMEHQGRTVLPKINQNALYQIATPIPPEAEQQEIAARIEAAFARIERAGAEAMRAAALVERLEQATLARAFRGAL